MLTTLRNFFAPPSLADDELQRQARVLYVFLWLMLLGAALAVVFFVILEGGFDRNNVTDLLVGLGVVGLFPLLRRGAVHWVGWAVCTLLLVGVTAVAINSFGLKSLGNTCYVFVIIIAGLVGHRTLVLYAAGGAGAALVGLYLWSLSGQAPFPVVPANDTTGDFFILFTITIMTTIATVYANRVVSEGQRQLRTQQQLLEQRVVERTRDLQAANQTLREQQTILLELKDKAEVANRVKSTFLANMSHELRTPLTAVIGYSELMLEALRRHQEDQTPRYIEKILTAARHLLSLINDVLDFAKLEAGHLALHAELLAVPKLVEETVSTVQPLVDENENHLHVSIAPEVSTIVADPLRIKQILVNLLGNAAKFTHQGTIRLSVAYAQKDTIPGVTFTIQDTGIGIAPAQLEALFQAFKQGDDSTTRRYGGTGLGLAISRQLCHMHHGIIEVQSTLGQGSTFTVWLPQRPSELGMQYNRN